MPTDVPPDAGLAGLLIPDRPPERFFAETYGRSWIRMSGPSQRYAEWFQPADLTRHAVGDFINHPGTGTASYDATYYDAAGIGRSFPAPLEMGGALLTAGMTLRFQELERTNPKLAELAAGASKLLRTKGTPVTVTSFVSPGGHGLPWHFDSPNVFVLQITGSKRWQLGRKRVAAPPFLMEAEGDYAEKTVAFLKQLGFTVELPNEADADEVLLSPGDVLYMPPGVWHRATAVGGPSCHISLLSRPLAFGKVLRALVTALAMKRESWRTDTSWLDEAGLVNFLANRLAEAQHELSLVSPAVLRQVLEYLAVSPMVRHTLLERCKDVL
jgi:hypothetical protein